MAVARDVADRVMFKNEEQILEEGNAAKVMASPRNPRTRAFLARYYCGAKEGAGR